MMPAFQTFIDRLTTAPNGDALGRAMQAFCGDLGFCKFTYLGFRRPGPQLPVYVTTYPTEWVYHYVGRRYQEIDPVVIKARQNMLPFAWDEHAAGLHASREQHRFFGEAAEFGIRAGLTVPIHDSQAGLATVTFVSDEKPTRIPRQLQHHRNALHLAAIYFHAHARQKLEDPLELERPHLSPREIACLQWVVRGKSTWDIAEILSISRRTVVFHVENAKRKLNAVTLPQAVAIALYNKLIEF